MEIEFILYVAQQKASTLFYSTLLAKAPTLDVPGMTEFQLDDNVKLGLMPEDGIAKIITPTTPHPKSGAGIPRCEIYLKVENAPTFIERGVQNGAQLVSEFAPRDWGDAVGYIADPDGHIIAFAEKIKPKK